MEAADDLFYREGIRAVGINRVLEEANTPIMTLYRHFGSKDGLATEYLKRRSERFLKEYGDGVNARASTPRGKILAAFDMLRELVEEPDFRGCAFINAAAEMASPDHEAVKIARLHKDAGRHWFATFAAEAGVPDPEGLAIQLMLLVDGGFVTADLYRESSGSVQARLAAETLVDAAIAAGQTAGSGATRSGKGATRRASRRAT